MKKNQALRTGALVCLLVTVGLAVVGLVGIIVFPILYVGAENFGNFFVGQIKVVGESFMFPFIMIKNGSDSSALVSALQSSCPNLYAVYSASGSLNTSLVLILSIVVYVLCLALLVGIIAGIILLCRRKKAKFIGYVVLMLAVVFMSAMVVMNGILYLDPLMATFQGGQGDIGALILGIVAVVFTAVALIMMIVTYFKGLKYAKFPMEKEEGELIAEAQPVLAEEAVTNEVVEQNTEEVLEETIEEIPDYEPEPEEVIVEEEPVVEEEPEPEDKKVEVTVNNNQPQGIDTNSLATLLREVVRDIVRDEIARNNVNQPKQEPQPQTTNSSVTGATFGGPLVVQYFNGGINGVTPGAQPAPAPAPVVAAAPAPVAPKAEEPAPVEAPAPEVVAEPVVEQPAEEKKVYERIPFAERLFAAEKELQDNYNEIKNEILSWGVKSRVSTSGDSFRLHKKMYVKLTIAGKSLKLYFALDPAEYESSTIPVQDASNKAAYQDTPLCFKVKSGLSVRRCKELIQATMEKDALEQGEVMKVNWVKELKAEMKAGKKPEKSKKSEEDKD